MKLSWKDVFNSDHRFCGRIDKAFEAASSVGYQYFSWNGWVYSCSGFKEERICKVEELI